MHQCTRTVSHTLIESEWWWEKKGLKAYVEDLVMNAQFVVDTASSSSSIATGGLHVSNSNYYSLNNDILVPLSYNSATMVMIESIFVSTLLAFAESLLIIQFRNKANKMSIYSFGVDRAWCLMENFNISVVLHNAWLCGWYMLSDAKETGVSDVQLLLVGLFLI